MDWRGSDGWRTCRVLDAVVGVKQFLVVTDDGRRPWHKQFRVRETEDGRRVAYWWGSFYYGDNARVHLSARVRRVAVRMLRLLSRNSDAISASKRAQLDRLKRMRGALSGKPWYGTIAGGRVHTESCNVLDYIGMAYLPDSPDCWQVDKVWPEWKHLAHGEVDCQEVWSGLEAASTEELVEMLGE